MPNYFANQVNKLMTTKKNNRKRSIFLLILAAIVAAGTVAGVRYTGVALSHKDKLLTCSIAESGTAVAHTHNSDCYDAEGRLVCTLPEVETHTHSEACFDEEGNLICGLSELPVHVHSEACFTTVTVEEEEPVQETAAEAENTEAPPAEEAAPAEQPAVAVEAGETDQYAAEANAAAQANAATEQEPAAAENAHPAADHRFTAAAGGITVAVTAPAAAFPEGTTMVVTPVYDKSILDTAAGMVEDTVKSVEAVDITFYDAAGREIEPAAPIRVTMTSAAIAESENSVIVHMADNGAANVVDGESSGNTVAFESDSFSVYVIVGTELTTEITLPGRDDIYEVSVTYGKDAKIPEGAHLEVTSFAYGSDEYNEAKEAILAVKKARDKNFDESKLGFAALDITIKDAHGKPVEPAAGAEVKVSIQLKKLPEGTDEASLNESLEIQHLNASTGKVVVETVAASSDVTVADGNATVEFTVDSFSTFTLTWGDNSATIHYGYQDTEAHTFVEFGEDKVAVLDTSVATVNLANTFEGYSYIGTTYKAPSSDDAYDMTSSILTRVENGWQITHKTSHEEDAEIVTENIANGSDIYVYYGVPSSHDPTPTGVDIPTPVTEKSVVVHEDGTATITLDITGTKVTETQSVGANVLIIFDRTQSMSFSMPGAANRMAAAKSAVATLVNILSTGENAGNDIDYSLVTFYRQADTIHTWGTDAISGRTTWTKNATAFNNYVQAIGYPSTNGTNWEAGLYQGRQALNSRDNDATYVIFITDGEPNRRGTGSSTQSANTATAISYALTQAQAITGMTNVSLYGVFCGSDSGHDNLADMIEDAHGVQTINGTDSATLTSAFEDIAHTIVTNLGATGVSVDDGITDLSSVSATVHGTTGGYKYYYKPEGATSWTEWTAENGAPGATYSEDNGVTWDLSAVGTLPAGTTYRIQFTVWPSQEALDLIANLNNGTIDYDDLDADVQKQITGNKTSGYTLATNTHLNTTYTFRGNTYTDPKTPLPSGEMPLASELMTVRKAFAHTINSQDPFTSIVFYLKVDGEYYQKDGTTSATLDESKVFALPVNTENDWKNSIYVAPGFIEGEEVLETGHKYTLEEKILVGNEYEYEFTPQTVRPMIINGTLTYLVLVDDYNAPGKNGVAANVKTYQIDNETYFVASTNNGELVGTNRKTAELDITKVVETNGILTDEQEAEECFTYRVTLQIPDGADPAGIVGYEYVYRPDQANAYFLYGYHEYEGGNPVASAFADDIARLGDNKYRAWNTLIYRDLVEWENVDGKIVSKKDADGNIIWKVPASGGYHTISYDMTLKQNEVLRFTNLPTGTKYTIQEIYANKYKADNVGGDTAGKAPVSDPSNIAQEGYAVTVKTTAGAVSGTAVANDTVSGTIEGLDTRFYNQFTNTMTKTVDVNLAGTKKLEGYEWSGESYHFTLAAGAEGNPMPDTATGRTEFDLTAANGTEDQTDTFGRLRFTAAGTYTYTVSETNAGTLQVVNGKAVQFGEAATVTIVIAEDPTTHDLSVESVAGIGVTWDETTKTVTAAITNTAPTTSVTAKKAWLNADESTTAPENAKVTFTLYEDGVITNPAVTVELDGTVDENGELAGWEATFSGLQKYKIENGEAVEIEYTIFEEDTGKWTGYNRVQNEPVADGETITNQQSTLWVQFKKTDMEGDKDGHRLAGAVFTFNDGDADITLTSGADGIMATAAAGTEPSADKFELAMRTEPYVLTETQAPAGYNMLTDVVNVMVGTTGVSAKLGDTVTQYTVTGAGTEDDPYVVVINNSAGVVLPNSGGAGTHGILLLGIALAAAATALIVFKVSLERRRRA